MILSYKVQVFRPYGFLREIFFKDTQKFSIILRYFYLFWKKWSHFNNLKSLNQKMIRAKLGWNRSSGSGEKVKNVEG